MTRKLGTQNVEEADERPKPGPNFDSGFDQNSIKRLSASELFHIIEIGAIYRAVLHTSRRMRTLNI